MVLISVLISGVAARVMGAAASASVSIDVVTTVPDVAASTVTSFRQASYRYGCSLLPSPAMLRRNMETGFMSKQTSWLMLWLIVGMTSSHPRSQFGIPLPKMASAASLVSAIFPANFVNPGVSIVLKSTCPHALSYGLLAVPGAWGHIAVSTTRPLNIIALMTTLLPRSPAPDRWDWTRSAPIPPPKSRRSIS